ARPSATGTSPVIPPVLQGTGPDLAVMGPAALGLAPYRLTADGRLCTSGRGASIGTPLLFTFRVGGPGPADRPARPRAVPAGRGRIRRRHSRHSAPHRATASSCRSPAPATGRPTVRRTAPR